MLSLQASPQLPFPVGHEILLPALTPRRRPLPLDVVGLSAGFPSPAADYEEKRLDINEYLVRNPVSTFIFSVAGDSMKGAGIFNGDKLVVDRSVVAGHGDIVVAFVNGERLVKYLYTRDGPVRLAAANPIYPAIEIKEGMDMVVWGVVTGKFTRMR